MCDKLHWKYKYVSSTLTCYAHDSKVHSCAGAFRSIQITWIIVDFAKTDNLPLQNYQMLDFGDVVKIPIGTVQKPKEQLHKSFQTGL